MKIRLFNTDDFVCIDNIGVHKDELTPGVREYVDAMQACGDAVRACDRARWTAFAYESRNEQADAALEADAKAADAALLALVERINRLGADLGQQIPWEDLIPSWLRASRLLAHGPAGVRDDS